MSKTNVPKRENIILVGTRPTSSSSSSNGNINDNTLAPTNEELGFTPIGSSSSGSYPNTTDYLKSSSMATNKPNKKKLVVRKQNKTNNNKDINNGGESKRTVNHTPYTPPNNSAGLQTGSNSGPYERSDMYSNEMLFEENEQTPDEHRTVLQALMGWDDIPLGGKWNHFIQHGFTGMHGKPLQEVLQMAQLETNRGGGSLGGNLRAKETHRRTIANQWDKLLSEWNSGRYASGDAYTVQEFFKEAERLKQSYADAGYNPNELRNPSINAGGFQQGFQKSLQDDRNKVDWIGGLLSSIQNRTANNPNWLSSNQATVLFDKLSEYVILSLAQSKGAIADAEKVRAQVEAMPRKDRAIYDKFMRTFFNANLVNQINSLAIQGHADAAEYENLMHELISSVANGEALTDKDGKLNGKTRNILGAVNTTYGRVFGNQDFLPINLDNATRSYDSVLDAFDQYMMKNANVDRQMVWDSALDIYDLNRTNYNDKIGKLGLNFGWDHKGHNLDRKFGEYLRMWQDEVQPQNEVLENATLYSRPVRRDFPNHGKGKKRGGQGG